LNDASKKNNLLRKLDGLRKNELFKPLFLVVIIILGVILFQEAIGLVLRTEYPLHTPISRSMEPTLRIGDLLVIQGGLRAEDIYANMGNGDIIIFHDPRDPDGIPIVHRAIDKYEENGTWYIVTKGDNNAFPDDWSGYFPKGGAYNKAGHPQSYLIGRVVLDVPLLGYVLRFLDETKIYLGGQGLTLRMIIIILLIAAFFFLEYTDSSGRSGKARKPEDKRQEEGLKEWTIKYKWYLQNPL